MAALLGEPVGRTVGYRVKLESRVSSATRIEVITEGILLRRLQQDPSLEVRQRKLLLLQTVCQTFAQMFRELLLLQILQGIDMKPERCCRSTVYSATARICPFASADGTAPVFASLFRAVCFLRLHRVLVHCCLMSFMSAAWMLTPVWLWPWTARHGRDLT
jgi:hypothetical protein